MKAEHGAHARAPAEASDVRARVPRGAEALHAASMLAAMAATLVVRDLRVVTAVGLLALFGLVASARGRWTATGAFGAANSVTLLRALCVGAFGCLGGLATSPVGALAVFAVFALDGLDGWLARRTGTASAFGARFDQECDAWLVLVAALALHLADRVGAFILVAGALRYFYTLALVFVPGARGDEPPSRTGRWAFSLLVSSLCASLWPLGPWHVALAVFATALLCLSFVRSVLWSWGPVRR
jgi:phosphatidylglycerophosphate synthase